MSSMLIKWIVFLALATITINVVSAQAPRKGKSKTTDTQNIFKKPEQNQDNAVPQSPFTPPHVLIVKEVSTKTPETPIATPAAKAIDVKAPKPAEEKPILNTGSPFSPPPSSKWQEQKQTTRSSVEGNRKPLQQKQQIPNGKSSQWLDSLEERQRENFDSIPPLANIDVGDTTNTDSNKSKRKFKVKPKTSVYQEKGQRDIHDAEPGATPWTRYTDKPRVNEEVPGSGKANARCGRLKYNPRNQICCEGKVLRRHGVSPACCKGDAFDTVFNKCCNGIISVRSNGQSDC